MISSIIKRDGRVVLFDMEKIAAAVEKALQSTSYYDRLSDEEQENYHSYVRIMAELDWPAYINGDTIFHQMIIDSYESDGALGVEAAIYNYYGALYLKELENQLSSSEVIKSERLPLFHEALLLYQLGYYYGAVAILIAPILRKALHG